MTEEERLEKWIEERLAEAPPLTPEQKDIISAALTPTLSEGVILSRYGYEND